MKILYSLITCMACTSLLLSSRAADAVDVPKDAAPLWRPRIIRPSFLYCSMGSQKRSLTPWTGETHRCKERRGQKINTKGLSTFQIIKQTTVYINVFGEEAFSINSHSWTTECMGPTPPRMPGSWFFLMSDSHSVTAYWITLSTPRRLESGAEKKIWLCSLKKTHAN